MRDCEGCRFPHRRMQSEGLINLFRIDLFAAAIDLLLQPSGEIQKSVGIEPSEVAGAQPAIVKAIPGCVAIAEIPANDRRAAQLDLSCFIGGSRGTVRTNDSDLSSRAAPDRVHTRQSAFAGYAGHDAGFRHAIAIQRRHAKHPRYAAGQFGGHGSTDTANEAQAVRYGRIGLQSGADGAMHCRPAGVPGGPKVRKPVRELLTVEAAGHDDGASDC